MRSCLPGKIITLAVLLIPALLSAGSFRFTAQSGTLFFGDAIGFTAAAGLDNSIPGWLGISNTALPVNLRLGASAGLDLTPVRFGLSTLNLSAWAGYRFNPAPVLLRTLEIMPYAALGATFNLFTTPVDAAFTPGLLLRAGTQAGMELFSSLTLGLDIFWNLNLSGAAVSTLSLTVYAGFPVRLFQAEEKK